MAIGITKLDARGPLSSSPRAVAKDDDDLLPKKKTSSSKTSSTKSSSKGAPSAQMLKIMRVVRGVGIVLGGFVTLVGFMSIVGLITDNFWVRLLVALVVVIGIPAFVTERLLRKLKGGGLGFVTDIFAIVLLLFALLLVAADFMSKPLFVREGDRYARSGSKTMARLVYYLGGVSPTFPEEGAPSGSASASASASGSAPTGSK